MMNYVLGINSGFGKHDGAAVLLKDGQVVAMAEQERFSRHKHAFSELAVDAIKYCLNTAEIDLQDLSAIALGWDERLFATIYSGSFNEDEFLKALFPHTVFRYDRYPSIRYVPHHI